jgi:prepilin-type N-terminal cleavage/methylation domain-containing protein
VTPRRSAFTLLEILVALAIIALVAGLVIPKLVEISGLELRSSVRRLAGAARYAGDQAAVRKTPYRLRFDLEARAYRVEYLDGEVWQPDRASLGGAVRLPHAVSIVSVETRGRGRKTEGEPWIEFYPKGYAERAAVQVAAGEQRIFTVEIRPFDTRPRVHAGALELADADRLAAWPTSR